MAVMNRSKYVMVDWIGSYPPPGDFEVQSGVLVTGDVLKPLDQKGNVEVPEHSEAVKVGCVLTEPSEVTLLGDGVTLQVAGQTCTNPPGLGAKIRLKGRAFHQHPETLVELRTGAAAAGFDHLLDGVHVFDVQSTDGDAVQLTTPAFRQTHIGQSVSVQAAAVVLQGERYAVRWSWRGDESVISRYLRANRKYTISSVEQVRTLDTDTQEVHYGMVTLANGWTFSNPPESISFPNQAFVYCKNLRKLDRQYGAVRRAFRVDHDHRVGTSGRHTGHRINWGFKAPPPGYYDWRCDDCRHQHERCNKCSKSGSGFVRFAANDGHTYEFADFFVSTERLVLQYVCLTLCVAAAAVTGWCLFGLRFTGKYKVRLHCSTPVGPQTSHFQTVSAVNAGRLQNVRAIKGVRRPATGKITAGLLNGDTFVPDGSVRQLLPSHHIFVPGFGVFSNMSFPRVWPTYLRRRGSWTYWCRTATGPSTWSSCWTVSRSTWWTGPTACGSLSSRTTGITSGAGSC
jgi:hypothetical protein